MPGKFQYYTRIKFHVDEVNIANSNQQNHLLNNLISLNKTFTCLAVLIGIRENHFNKPEFIISISASEMV